MKLKMCQPRVWSLEPELHCRVQQVYNLIEMSYNNVEELITALRAMDARVRAAILEGEVDKFIQEAEGEMVSREDMQMRLN